MEIPEPRIYTDSEYSGRFTLRVPRTLHRQLAQEAEMEGVSLNQFILSLISYNLGARIFNKDNGEKQTVSPRLFLQGSPGQT